MADAHSKACIHCKRDLPTSSFYAHESHRDGLTSACRECVAKQCKARYETKKKPPILDATCVECGKPFKLARASSSQKHCSTECRLWSKIDRSGGESSCWPWIAKSVSATDGVFEYGIFRFNNKTQRAHRVAWQLTHGPIPDGLFVCHKCDNPRCCNPSHFFLGTPKDNHDDMLAKGRIGHMSKEGRARLIASKAGKTPPPHVMQAARRACLGRKQGKEEIAKRAESLRRAWKDPEKRAKWLAAFNAPPTNLRS
jgi:hypothetical protein